MTPWHRHFIFTISVAAGILALGVALGLHHPLAYAIGANTFFSVYIALLLRQMPRLTADFLSRRAQQADEPVWIIFLVTAVIICVAVGSLFMLINARQMGHPYALAFSMFSLPLGWFTIHSMAALHYANLFWKGDETGTANNHRQSVGGLDFPGTKRPCGWDFLYFSVVIGMTAQTADTGITRTPMRQAAMVHAIISFFYNTVIVAAAVNLVVSLAN